MAESLEPNRIDGALMAALQALTDVQDVYRVGWVGSPMDLWERVDLVRRELEQILQDRRGEHDKACPAIMTERLCNSPDGAGQRPDAHGLACLNHNRLSCQYGSLETYLLS